MLVSSKLDKLNLITKGLNSVKLENCIVIAEQIQPGRVSEAAPEIRSKWIVMGARSSAALRTRTPTTLHYSKYKDYIADISLVYETTLEK